MVDFKQAYDNFNRNKLWNSLIKLGIQSKIVKLIKWCNSNTKCVVQEQGDLIESFEVVKELKQDHLLSLVLFNLALKTGKCDKNNAADNKSKWKSYPPGLCGHNNPRSREVRYRKRCVRPNENIYTHGAIGKSGENQIYVYN